MTACGEGLTIVGTREWDLGKCAEFAGHQGKHVAYGTDLRGRPFRIEWDEDELWYIPMYEKED